jgi:hypothetical protein
VHFGFTTVCSNQGWDAGFGECKKVHAQVAPWMCLVHTLPSGCTFVVHTLLVRFDVSFFVCQFIGPCLSWDVKPTKLLCFILHSCNYQDTASYCGLMQRSNMSKSRVLPQLQQCSAKGNHSHPNGKNDYF